MMLAELLAEVAPSTAAGIITSVATVFTALGGLTLSLSVLLPVARRTRRIDEQVATVHTIVNQQRTDAQRYNIALAEILKAHGIALPIDQSLPVTGAPDHDQAHPAPSDKGRSNP